MYAFNVKVVLLLVYYSLVAALWDLSVRGELHVYVF